MGKNKRQPMKQTGGTSNTFVELFALSPGALEATTKSISKEEGGGTVLESERRSSKRIGGADIAFAIKSPVGHDRTEISRRFLGRPAVVDEGWKPVSRSDGMLDDIWN